MPVPQSAKNVQAASGPAKSGPVTSKVKVPLSKMLGADAAKVQEAIAKHADDETRYGYINLPPGIDNGIARLTAAYFSQYKKGQNEGKIFFRATGNVFQPTTATARDGSKMRVKGLVTSIQIPLFDQKNKKGEIYSDLERQTDIIMNELRKLGGDTKGATIDDMEMIAETLVAAAPFFKFHTTPRIAQEDGNGFKKGEVTGAYENWDGTEGLEDYTPEQEQLVGNDNTESVATNGQTSGKATTTTATSTNGTTKATAVGPKKSASPQSAAVEEAPAFVPETSEDLDTLVAHADSDSDLKADAENRLKELGIAAGISDKEQLKMNTWADVAAAIQEAWNAAATEGNENTDDGEGLKVGDFVGFHPKNPVTKKKQKDAVRAEVTALGEDKVDLKVGKASYKNVPFDDLVADPGE